MSSNRLILCRTLLRQPSIFPRVFPNEALRMERHTIAWNWKDQYYQNFYSIQGNLQIQSNPYQITNGIFHKLSQLKKKKNRETQKTLNDESNFEKEKMKWRNKLAQTTLQSYSHQDSMVLAQNRYRSLEQYRKSRNKPTDLLSISNCG